MKTKINLPFGKRKNRISFNPSHETTLGFGSFIPAYIHYLAPNESLSVDMNFFARVAPMVVPTFGDVRVNFISYFVPFSHCWDYFDDFIEGISSPTPNSNNGYTRFSKVPQVSTDTIITTLLKNSRYATPSNNGLYDVWINPQDYDNLTAEKYVFTKQGKTIWQLLQCLGMNIRTDKEQSSSGQYFNALPLLAFIYLYYENFIPQQYKVYNYIRNVKQVMHDLVPDSSGRLEIPAQEFEHFINYLVLAYKQDYFTSMWSQPNQVNQGNFHVSSSEEPEVVKGLSSDSNGIYGQVEVARNNNGELGVTSVNNEYPITPWAITLAQKLQGWFTRHNLAGTDFISSVLADFGVAPSNEKGSIRYCGQFETQLKIDSVFDTAGVETSEGFNKLGSYAGKGIMASKAPTFRCSTKEHGLFFIIATVESRSHYVDGLDRLYMYEDKFDFFNPTFDGLNMQAVASQELHNFLPVTFPAAQSAINAMGMYSNRIIGFLPRYAERKFTRSRVTGDFNLPTLRTSIEGFTLQRNLFKDKFDPTKGLSSGDEQVTLSGIVYEKDAVQYNRVFTDWTGLADPIFALFDFKVNLETPMLPMKESFNQYESESNSIEMEKNGSYKN